MYLINIYIFILFILYEKKLSRKNTIQCYDKNYSLISSHLDSRY